MVRFDSTMCSAILRRTPASLMRVPGLPKSSRAATADGLCAGATAPARGCGDVRSSSRMRPPGPLPWTRARSMPSLRARCRTDGAALTAYDARRRLGLSAILRRAMAHDELGSASSVSVLAGGARQRNLFRDRVARPCTTGCDRRP